MVRTRMFPVEHVASNVTTSTAGSTAYVVHRPNGKNPKSTSVRQIEKQGFMIHGSYNEFEFNGSLTVCAIGP